MQKEVSIPVVVAVIGILLILIIVVFWKSSQQKAVDQPRVTAPPVRIAE